MGGEAGGGEPRRARGCGGTWSEPAESESGRARGEVRGQVGEVDGGGERDWRRVGDGTCVRTKEPGGTKGL